MSGAPLLVTVRCRCPVLLCSREMLRLSLVSLGMVLYSGMVSTVFRLANDVLVLVAVEVVGAAEDESAGAISSVVVGMGR